MSLPHTIDVVNAGIASGDHLGAQICVMRHGKVIADIAVGESRPGVPMTADTINLWLSMCKPVGAVALAQLHDRSPLSFDDPVAKFIPEFSAHGKDAITLRHLLTHTGGFRFIPGMTFHEPWDQIISRICSMKPETGWIPGEKAGYHPATSWFILGEIVRRLDGRTYDRYVREEIFLPLGMNDCWIGMDRAAHHTYGTRIGGMFNTSKRPVNFDEGSFSEDACARVSPAGNGRGPMNQLVKFYAAMTSKDEGGRMKDVRASDSSLIIQHSSLHDLTTPHRTGMFDHTFKSIINFGLGFILQSNQENQTPPPYGYGEHAGEKTFGHSGAESSCAFCDPENDLIAAWVCNGMCAYVAHQQRQLAVNSAIYEDLALKSP